MIRFRRVFSLWGLGATTAFAYAGAPGDTKTAFFGRPMYYMHVRAWDANKMTPAALADRTSVPGAVFEVFRIDPQDPKHCPTPAESELVYRTEKFDLGTSGNKTKGTPKSSYRIGLPKKDNLADMSVVNLKSMWNDVSQMREALAWEMFRLAEVPAPLHTYARFCINDRYFGLYSVIEQIDRSLVKDRFKRTAKGNLYRTNWNPDDLGPATLAYRTTAEGKDDGSAYFKISDVNERTYSLKAGNESDALQTSYDDLAQFIRVLNGRDPAASDFASPEYATRLGEVFDIQAFLRWAAVNSLMGSWDNYWQTPANYALYNGGREGDTENFVDRPYFRWIPWDYDNTFGIAYDETKWHNADILDWEKIMHRTPTMIPLMVNAMKNPQLRAYYLNFMRRFMESTFNEAWVEGRIEKIWPLISKSVFLESDSPQGAPHTARQFSNDQVFWNGYKPNELQKNGERISGILSFVRARTAAVKAQLEAARQPVRR